MIHHNTRFMEEFRHLVEVPRDGIRDGLRLVVIVQTREFGPAVVVRAKFDQASSQHDSKRTRSIQQINKHTKKQVRERERGRERGREREGERESRAVVIF